MVWNFLVCHIKSQPYLDYLSLILPYQFSKAFYQYILNLMSEKKLGCFNDLVNPYFQSFICLPSHDMNIFWPTSLSKFPWRFWTEFSQSWNNLKKTLQYHENLWSLTDLSGANIGFHSNSRDWLFWVFMMSKINSLINEQKCVVLARCVNNFLYLYKELQKCNSRVWRYHCSTCIEYIYLYTRIV